MLYLHYSIHILFTQWFRVHSRIDHPSFENPSLRTFNAHVPTLLPEWFRSSSFFLIFISISFIQFCLLNRPSDPNQRQISECATKAWWAHNAQISDVGARRRHRRTIILPLIQSYRIYFCLCWFIINFGSSLSFFCLIKISRTKFLLRWVECNILSW